MTIVKTADGWLVEPSTKEELEHLWFLFNALKSLYGQVVETKLESSPASQSLPVYDSQSKAALG